MTRGASAGNGPSAGTGSSPGMGTAAMAPEAADLMSGNPLRLAHWWWM